jgi:hypothetical protein
MNDENGGGAPEWDTPRSDEGMRRGNVEASAEGIAHGLEDPDAVTRPEYIAVSVSMYQRSSMMLYQSSRR